MKLSKKQLKKIIVEIINERDLNKNYEIVLNESYFAKTLERLKIAWKVIANFTRVGKAVDKAIDVLPVTKEVKSSIGHFVDAYITMVDMNYRNSDKFFHCLANCQAAKEGYSGEKVAQLISYVREEVDTRFKGAKPAERKEDEEANAYGRQGANINSDCAEHCNAKYGRANPDLHPDYLRKRKGSLR